MYELLDKYYIKETKSSKEEIIEALKQYYKNKEFIAKELETTDNEFQISSYFLDGILLEENQATNFQIMVRIDYTNMSFSIIPFSDTLKRKIIVGEVDEMKENIEKNAYNIYSYTIVSDEAMMQKMFDLNKFELLHNREEAFAKLDETYKNKRFGDFETFNKYLDNVQSMLKYAKIVKYEINRYDDYIEYVCVDYNGFYYIFLENSVMNYKVRLDDYTIPTSRFLGKYNNETDENKAKICVDTFIQMINNQDYLNAYKALSTGFKNNYFKTQEDFEKYVQNNFYKINGYGIIKSDSEGDLYYFTVNLADHYTFEVDESGLRKTISKTFIVKLGKGTDFELSFNVE